VNLLCNNFPLNQNQTLHTLDLFHYLTTLDFGLEGNYYTINSQEQFFNYMENYSADGLKFRLKTDITYTGDYSAQTISGEFDGDGNTISGLTITSGSSNVGLFHYAQDAYIHDLELSFFNINPSSGTYVGALVGQVDNEVNITNVNLTNSILDASSYVGGLVGGTTSSAGNYLNVENCTISGSEIRGNSAGGIIGNSYYADTDIVNSQVVSNSVINATVAAGLVAASGSFGAMSIQDSYVDNISIEGSSITGGLHTLTSITPTVSNSFYPDDLIFSISPTIGTEYELERFEFDCWIGNGKDSSVSAFRTCRYGPPVGLYYIIDNMTEFDFFVEEAHFSTYFRLNTDIDLSGKPTDFHIPLLRSVFDGNGFTIANLTQTSGTDYCGLFDQVSGGDISNLVISDFNINIPTANSGCAALVGDLEGTVDISNVVVRDTSVIGGTSVGGLVGFSDGNLDFVGGTGLDGNVVLSGLNFVGGLVGYTSTGTLDITDSEIKNGISITSSMGSSSRTGGLVGRVSLTTTNIDSSYVGDNVNITGGGSTGGLIGLCGGSTTIDDSYTNNSVKITSNNDAGGLVGLATSSVEISDSFSDNIEVNGTDIGGLAGNSTTNVVFINSYYPNDLLLTGNIVDSSQEKIGEIFDCWLSSGKPTDFTACELLLFDEFEPGIYAINNMDEFEVYAESYADQGLHFRLNRSFDLTGEGEPNFNISEIIGIFDGNGYSISNLNLTCNTDDCGFYLNAGNAKIANLTLVNFYVGSTENNVGGLVGHATDDLTIENISIVNSDISGNSNVGGLIGYSESVLTLDEVYVDGTNASGVLRVGGVAGTVDGHVNGHYVEVGPRSVVTGSGDDVGGMPINMSINSSCNTTNS
jgi:hypothetical protein